MSKLIRIRAVVSDERYIEADFRSKLRDLFLATDVKVNKGVLTFNIPAGLRSFAMEWLRKKHFIKSICEE